MPKKAIIIGAGPAGLTAAYELLHKTDIIPVIIEQSGDIGGLSRTVNYKGNRIDIGGHRFFSKSDRVVNWWLKILPIEQQAAGAFSIEYHNMSYTVNAEAAPENADPEKVMLVRNRLSRVYYNKQFFPYPITLSLTNIRKLGIGHTTKIFFSYVQSRLFPRKEVSLEDFFINRFGTTLYKTFFKSYTEKVWGVPCHRISAEWGAQRIKELSISKTLLHAAKSLFQSKNGTIAQKDTPTSLIQRFLYPKYGPGQLWEEVARIIREKGGEIHFNTRAHRMYTSGNNITRVTAIEQPGNTLKEFEGDYFFSTMPVKDLIEGLQEAMPDNVAATASGLEYRDFIMVGLLLNKLSFTNAKGQPIEDNWIYLQDATIQAGRMQIFNNWSPGMVQDPDKIWVGVEYFCNTTDPLWQLSDEKMAALAAQELKKIGFIHSEDLLDSTVLRVEKTYPAYFGTYSQFHLLQDYLNTFPNLFLIGRNGMHKYNNADHSMLTAMTAVENIINNTTTKENIWAINTEQDYHEK